MQTRDIKQKTSAKFSPVLDPETNRQINVGVMQKGGLESIEWAVGCDFLVGGEKEQKVTECA
jgi:hypothetical protein